MPGSDVRAEAHILGRLDRKTAMGVQDALGSPGRSGGVEHDQRVFGFGAFQLVSSQTKCPTKAVVARAVTTIHARRTGSFAPLLRRSLGGNRLATTGKRSHVMTTFASHREAGTRSRQARIPRTTARRPRRSGRRQSARRRFPAASAGGSRPHRLSGRRVSAGLTRWLVPARLIRRRTEFGIYLLLPPR